MACREAQSALQRQKRGTEQDAKRSPASTPTHRCVCVCLCVCVCVCPRGRSRGGSTGANLHSTPPALRFYYEHVTLLKCRQTGT